MAKIIVDKSKCIGCCACVSMAPDAFELDENGLSEAKENVEVTEEVKDACECCPLQAITIEEE